MSTQPATIVQRLWNYCNVLRDDGVSHGCRFKNPMAAQGDVV
jgi:hypothetical protein